jgi:hypothetical protein
MGAGLSMGHGGMHVDCGLIWPLPASYRQANFAGRSIMRPFHRLRLVAHGSLKTGFWEASTEASENETLEEFPLKRIPQLLLRLS